MVDLLVKGVVPLTDPAQIARGLDPEAPPKRPTLLLWIERSCRDRENEGVLPVIGRSRLSTRQSSTPA
jgi:hypothetical protein